MLYIFWIVVNTAFFRRLSTADTDVNTTLVTSGFSSSALRNSFYNAKRKCVRALSLNSNLGPNLSAPATPTEFQLSDSPRTPISAGPTTPKFFIGRTKTRAASAIEPCTSTVFFPKVETVQEICAEWASVGTVLTRAEDFQILNIILKLSFWIWCQKFCHNI